MRALTIDGVMLPKYPAPHVASVCVRTATPELPSWESTDPTLLSCPSGPAENVVETVKGLVESMTNPLPGPYACAPSFL